MSRLTTPPLSARRLALEIGLPEAEVRDAIEELTTKGYLTPLSRAGDAVAWQVHLPAGGGR